MRERGNIENLPQSGGRRKMTPQDDRILFRSVINFAILLKYYLCLITENYMRPLIYSPVQFPATKYNPPLAVDLRSLEKG
jgi:hypothetical protein